LRDGIVALVNIDDRSSISSTQIKELAEHMRIPYFDSYWDAEESKIARSQSNSRDKYSINIHPDWFILSKSFIDLINFNQWHNFTLIYENSDGNKVF